MKKLFYLFATMAFLMTSCDNKSEIDDLSNNNDTQFGGLNVKLPTNYNDSILTLSLSDLQNKFYTQQNGILLRSGLSEEVFITLDEMSTIVDDVSIKYPNTDSLTVEEIEKIKSNFTDLDDEEIVDNIGIIDSFYTTLIRYDVVQELAKEDPTTSKVVSSRCSKVATRASDYFGYDLNSSEFWYLVWHPTLVSPIRKATDKALDLTKTNFPGLPLYQDKGDAFRHTIWNALIAKYIGVSKNNVNDCIERAKDFTDRHESGADKPSDMTDELWNFDGKMDYHNNEQGRNYFKQVSWIIREGFFRVKRVRAPSEDQMAIDIKKLTNTAKKVSMVGDISLYPDSLVYIKD